MKKPGCGRAWLLRLQRLPAHVVLAVISIHANLLHAPLAIFPDIRRGRVCGAEFADDGFRLKRLQSLNLCLSVEKNLPGVPQLVAVTGPALAVDGAEYLAVLGIHIPIADQILEFATSLGQLVVAGGGAIAGDLAHYPSSLTNAPPATMRPLRSLISFHACSQQSMRSRPLCRHNPASAASGAMNVLSVSRPPER